MIYLNLVKSIESTMDKPFRKNKQIFFAQFFGCLCGVSKVGSRWPPPWPRGLIKTPTAIQGLNYTVLKNNYDDYPENYKAQTHAVLIGHPHLVFLGWKYKTWFIRYVELVKTSDVWSFWHSEV